MADWMLVDGSSVIFRAFYGIPKTMRAPSGMLNNGIRGALDIIARMVTEHHPVNLVVATDEDWRPKWRVDLIPGYKAHRVAEPVPPELDPQIPVAWDVLRAIGIAVIGAKDYEAEDIIASLAASVTGTIQIVSGDRDLFALVRDPDITVLYPGGKGVWTEITEAYIRERYGIPGRAYAQYAVLRGDPSDGLPGLSGVGDKTAASMVQRHGSIEAIVESGAISDANIDYLRRAIKVVTPVADIDLELPDCRVPATPKDPGKLEELKVRHGLGGAVERLVAALPRASRSRG